MNFTGHWVQNNEICEGQPVEMSLHSYSAIIIIILKKCDKKNVDIQMLLLQRTKLKS